MRNKLCLFLSVLFSFSFSESNIGITTLLAQSEPPIITDPLLLEFTLIPDYGTSDDLVGRTHNVNPDSFRVAVYVFVEGSGWWTKPTFAEPLTPIQSDSTWSCDITTGGSDIYATGIHAFLIPIGVSPPQAAGLSDLPPSLDTISIADVSTVRYGRSLIFSGYEWWAKASVGPVGPGPNHFSDSQENVWLDDLGQLHLRITHRDGIWYCPEVISKSSFGYGRYIFQTVGMIGQMDRNVVLGLFTWDNASAQSHREIDIEFSQWGVQQDTNAQYVIQPYDRIGNLHRWRIPILTDSSTHTFEWKSDSVQFLSVKGHQSKPPFDSALDTWLYVGSGAPSHGNETARMNLWLFNGVPPRDSTEVEIVIKKFEYINTTVGVGHNGHSAYTPSSFFLSQNYPNPFNPVTTIDFSIPHTSYVSLQIYDVLGERLATLLAQPMNPGTYHLQWHALEVASGIYFCRLQAGSFTDTKKLVLLR